MSYFGAYFGDFWGAYYGGVGTEVDVVVETSNPTPVVDAAVARLVQQFRDKPRIVALVRALAGPAQALEDALQQLLTQRSIFVAVGAQLDAIGVIVGQAREGLSDDDYRRYLFARIATNRSRGRVEDILKIALLVLNDPAAIVSAQDGGRATAVVFVTGIIPGQALANILFRFLDQARVAGVRLILETLTADEDDSFTTAIAAYTSGTPLIGDTIVQVNSVDGFPALGTLDLDIGTATYERVTYDGVLSTLFLNVSPLAHNHTANTAVQLADTPGQGFARIAIGTGGIVPGNTSIVVDTTRDFPASGSLVIDPDGAAELQAYTSKNATNFFLSGVITGTYGSKTHIIPATGDLGGKLTIAQDRVL